MSVRFRRKRRLFILLILLITAWFYLINSPEESSVTPEDEKSLPPISTVKEDFVEIEGKKLRKIDWHDYQSITREANRIGIYLSLIEEKISYDFYQIGPGERGIDVEVSAEEKNRLEFHQLYQKNGFNALISEKISLDRSVRDIRYHE